MLFGLRSPSPSWVTRSNISLLAASIWMANFHTVSRQQICNSAKPAKITQTAELNMQWPNILQDHGLIFLTIFYMDQSNFCYNLIEFCYNNDLHRKQIPSLRADNEVDSIQPLCN